MSFRSRVMNRPFKIIALVLTLLLILPALSCVPDYTVKRVADGDTVTVKTSDAKIRVRLVGIDATELS